ncbi:Similar to TRMT6: tRNA (adenine(58)-N(1))-methyltransferase non-catalytic subunit TRM6 (Homo sapiens) [Cotesia congregata]|uniref:tRNA (adenine(58)-N(1))-methyltransferase non-catalytic subunit TRM6 n=1 Tax=Cotesia congregata TaxID=51543 RepID=A0A8J2HPM5_COTCN|nr:Similar to TRMT6: tRNA (adenine(58)-N(1))-methyltransferase non-catalytic subunit TRM6 (Homo sapiens) [Cotesia congregata]
MDKEVNCQETVSVGDYIIIQKQDYRKVCRITRDGTFTLGKEQVEMSGIINKPYWTTFKMIGPVSSLKNGLKTITLEVAEKAETSENIHKGLASGSDNRSINDDGTSQKLSKAEIEDLREAGKSSKEIVGYLIENSSSFSSKTEYSQEKYIKKKETKYCRYLTILKPTVGLLQEIYFRQDPGRVNCLRMDTLSQILSYCDVKSEGKYLLYDGGSCGLASAAMLSRIGANTQEELAKKYALSALRRQNSENHDVNHQAKKPRLEPEVEDDSTTTSEEEEKKLNDVIMETDIEAADELIKTAAFKKPKWFQETKEVVDCLKLSKADGLAIVAKEHPLNIVNALLPYLEVSKPFVIYHCYREPLQETYVALKSRKDVINLRLLSNFCRGYQVLPNRTHPEITTNDLGGYLLAGYLVS